MGGIDGVNGVGKKEFTQHTDGIKFEEQQMNSVYGNGYKGTEKVSAEETVKQKQNAARLNAEQKEMDDKGITDPKERAQYLQKKDIETGRLKWVPEQNAMFGLLKTGGYYEYRTEDEGLYGAEKYADVAARYGFSTDKFRKDGNYVSADGRIYDGKLKLKPDGMPLPAE